MTDDYFSKPLHEKKPPLTFSYNAARDLLTVEGIPFSGDFFRCFAEPDPEALYQLTKIGEVVIIREVNYSGVAASKKVKL